MRLNIENLETDLDWMLHPKRIIKVDNYDYITSDYLLSHPFSFQPVSVTKPVLSYRLFSKYILKILENTQLNFFHFIKQYMITSLYIFSFVVPDLSFL